MRGRVLTWAVLFVGCAGVGPETIRTADPENLAAYARDERAWVRELALDAMASEGEAQAAAILADHGERPFVRAAAARLCGRLALTSAIPPLLNAVEEGQPALALAAIDALAQIGAAHPEEVPAVREALHHLEPSDPLLAAKVNLW